MNNKAVFLDRDGTIIEDKGYTYKLSDLILFSEAVAGLKKLKEFLIFIITNQSGVKRGYFSIEDLYNFNQKLVSNLEKKGVRIKKTYYCPHVPEDRCDCRKPSSKFIEIATKKYNINLKGSFVIGDKPSDIMLAKNAGTKSIYVLTGQGVKYLKESRKKNPDYVATDIMRAANYILFKNEKKIMKKINLKKIVSTTRKNKKTIVTLNGTFDILHKGHDYIISEAKKQGDVLIVAVNSDKSVKKNKGPERPINNENSRARMIAAYKEVDYVIVFEEIAPINLLGIIKPDVHVNGSEYGKNCIEASIVRKNGGKIHIVKLLPRYSSTNFLEGKFYKKG